MWGADNRGDGTQRWRVTHGSVGNVTSHPPVVLPVVDLPWLSGDDTHLERARATEGRVVLAGGLGPENVREAIEAVRPWAVDASSSLEVEPGIKDHDRVRAFVAAAR